MKLPRYLQVSLLATIGMVVWSQWADDEATPVISPVPPTVSPRPAASVPPPSAPQLTVRNTLFSLPLPDVVALPAEPDESVAVEPPAPDLPLQALGAWWSKHQRIILLTDGMETWPVCQQCRAEGSIWIGSEPVSGWKLKAVEKDHLLFEWQLTHVLRSLELGELQSEPTQ